MYLYAWGRMGVYIAGLEYFDGCTCLKFGVAWILDWSMDIRFEHGFVGAYDHTKA